MKSASEFEIGGHSVPPGERRDLELAVSQSYTGVPIALPLTVWRAEQTGPVVGVTATLHGNELNGIGVIRELITAPPFELQGGTLVLAPVLNVLGFERHSRYLPDRRDLNRCFPGTPDGSPASRFAHAIFREIAMGCDQIIDLHTAAARRTNFPNVRADLKDAGARRLAVAFGCELMVHGKGPRGSLRRSACAAGRPAIILEAGEVGKIEPRVVECGVRGVRNVLIELGMVAGVPVRPAYQVRIQKTTWVRADRGGLLQFHVAPGDLVESGQPLATNSNLHGRELNVIHAPDDGVVLGMTTLPAVTPGDAVFHLAVLPEGAAAVKKAMRDRPEESLHERLRDDLATSVAVSEPSTDNSRQPEQPTE